VQTGRATQPLPLPHPAHHEGNYRQFPGFIAFADQNGGKSPLLSERTRPPVKDQTMRALRPVETEIYLRQAEKALRGQPHLSQRPLRLNCSQGRLHLEGQVSTFYEKQMAQEVLRQFDQGVEIENCLDVSWT
jgi:hypothetical protein